MNLYSTCTHCKTDISIKQKAPTRGDFQMKYGNSLELKCEHCGENQNVHINKIRAKESKLILLSGFIVSLIVTAFLWSFYGAISTVTIVIPVLVWYQQIKNTRSFNHYMIRRT